MVKDGMVGGKGWSRMVRQDSLFIREGRSTAGINLGKVLGLQIIQDKGYKSESQEKRVRDMRQRLKLKEIIFLARQESVNGWIWCGMA